MPKLGVFVGSIRERSWSQKVANVLSSMFPDNWDVKQIDIASVPFYNQDWDDSDTDLPLPAAAQNLRDAVSGVDALLFVTPEYNRTVPAVLKNAIDVISRPSGSFIAAGKPAMVVSVSTGAIGGFGANHSLRQNLMFLNVPVMAQPELYLSSIHKAFGFDNSQQLGTVSDLEQDLETLDAGTKKFLRSAVDKFVDFAGRWIEA